MRECAESSEQGVRTLSPAPSAAVSPVAMAVSTKLHSSANDGARSSLRRAVAHERSSMIGEEGEGAVIEHAHRRIDERPPSARRAALPRPNSLLALVYPPSSSLCS